MTRTMDTTTHAWTEMRKAGHHRRVQEWRQSRPVVSTVKQQRSGPWAGWWSVTCGGSYDWFRHHENAVREADWLARDERRRREATP